MKRQHFNGTHDDIYNVGQNAQQEQTQTSIRDRLNELRGRVNNNSSSTVTHNSPTHTQEQNNTNIQGLRQRLSGRS